MSLTMDADAYYRIPGALRRPFDLWLEDVIGENPGHAFVTAIHLGEGTLLVEMLQHVDGRVDVDGPRRVVEYRCPTLPPVWIRL